MTNSIYQSQIIEMKELDNLFIEMTSKSCNQRCKNCYIDFPLYKKQTDFIDVDIIRQGLYDTTREKIKCIYLTGAEPMTHPDFNSILRLCLKRSDVCICTNGSFINEKKARFLKKVESESSNEVIFKISLDHYDEIKNDDVRYRGAYRHGMFAIKHLLKYGFSVVVSLTNFYNLSKDEIYSGFKSSFNRYEINPESIFIQISPFHNKQKVSEEFEVAQSDCFDCTNSRILSSSGVYTCPFLANDFRGRCGSSFADYNKRCSLETEYCTTCAKSSGPVFSLDFSLFK